MGKKINYFLSIRNLLKYKQIRYNKNGRKRYSSQIQFTKKQEWLYQYQKKETLGQGIFLDIKSTFHNDRG